MTSLVNFTSETFKGELRSILPKFFKKIEEEGTFPNSFYKASITLMPKSEKNNTRKENSRLMSVMNVDAKMLNKILANQI